MSKVISVIVVLILIIGAVLFLRVCNSNNGDGFFFGGSKNDDSNKDNIKNDVENEETEKDKEKQDKQKYSGIFELDLEYIEYVEKDNGKNVKKFKIELGEHELYMENWEEDLRKVIEKYPNLKKINIINSIEMPQNHWDKLKKIADEYENIIFKGLE